MTTDHPSEENFQPGKQGQSFLERHNIHPVIFAFASLFFVFVLYQLVAGSLTFLIIGTTNITRSNVLPVRLLTMVGQGVFILVPTLLLAGLLSTKRSGVFHWRVPTFQETLFASISLLLLQQIFQVYLFFQDRIPLPDALRKMLDPLRQMMEQVFKNLVMAESIHELLLVILVVAIIPAITEELFFRGLIQSAFEKSLAPLWAAFLTGTIFGLYHFNPFAVIPLIGLGCFFGFLRLRSNSILIAMTAHFLNNAMAVVAVYFNMEEGVIIGGEKGLEPGLTGILAQFFLFLMMFVLSFSAYVRASAHVRERRDESM